MSTKIFTLLIIISLFQQSHFAQNVQLSNVSKEIHYNPKHQEVVGLQKDIEGKVPLEKRELLLNFMKRNDIETKIDESKQLDSFIPTPITINNITIQPEQGIDKTLLDEMKNYNEDDKIIYLAQLKYEIKSKSAEVLDILNENTDVIEIQDDLTILLYGPVSSINKISSKPCIYSTFSYLPEFKYRKNDLDKFSHSDIKGNTVNGFYSISKNEINDIENLGLIISEVNNKSLIIANLGESNYLNILKLNWVKDIDFLFEFKLHNDIKPNYYSFHLVSSLDHEYRGQLSVHGGDGTYTWTSSNTSHLFVLDAGNTAELIATGPCIEFVTITDNSGNSVIVQIIADNNLEPLDSRKLVNADKTWAAGRSGTNQRIGILDSGLWKDDPPPGHPDFSSDPNVVAVHPEEWREGKTNNTHGTHVAGIAAGRAIGTDDGSIKGVAFDAAIRSYGLWSNDNSLSEIYSDFVSNDFNIVNNSWGEDNYSYSTNSNTIDEIIYTDEMFVIFSAGNDGDEGNYTITAPSNAKNSITVGSISYVVNSSENLGGVSEFSSKGPTQSDGRLCIDLVAPGGSIDVREFGVISNRGEYPAPNTGDGIVIGKWAINTENDDLYHFLSGTSMAAPHVTGAAGLWREGTEHQSPDVKPHDLRAMLIANAIPLENSSGDDAQFGYPSTDAGFGLLDTYHTAFDNVGEEKKTIRWSNGEFYRDLIEQETQGFSVPGNPKRVIFVLAYSDVPGEESNSKALKNDIDMEITRNGVTLDEWETWVLNNLTNKDGDAGTEGPIEKIVDENPGSNPMYEARFYMEDWDNNTGTQIQEYSWVCIAQYENPQLDLFVQNTTFNVEVNQVERLQIPLTAINTGGMTAAGITARLEGTGIDDFQGFKEIFVGNVVGKNSQKSKIFSLAVPNQVGNYNFNLSIMGINKNLNSPSSVPISINVIDPSDGLSSGSVSPVAGTPNNEYTFTVTYKSSLNQAPTNGVFLKIANLPPLQMNPSGSNWEEGVEYTFSLLGLSLNVGNNDFYFECENSTGTLRFPESNNLNVFVSDPTAGYDLALKGLQIDDTWRLPGQDINFEFYVKNYGYAVSNYDLLYQLINSNGDVVAEETEPGPPVPEQQQTPPQNINFDVGVQPEGFYKLRVSIVFNLDNVLGNNQDEKSVYIGNSNPYTTYEYEDGGDLVTGVPRIIAGHEVELVSHDANSARVKVDGSSNWTQIQYNEIKFFDADRFGLVYVGSFGSNTIAVKYAIPSNAIKFDITNFNLEAGITKTIHFISNGDNSIDVDPFSAGGEDEDLIAEWNFEANTYIAPYTDAYLDITTSHTSVRRNYDFWLKINAVGEFIQKFDVNVIDPLPDFTYSLSKSQITLAPGMSDEIIIEIYPLFGFSEIVTLSLDNIPSGVSYSFTSNNVQLPDSITLNIDVESNLNTFDYYELTLNLVSNSRNKKKLIGLDIIDGSENFVGINSVEYIDEDILLDSLQINYTSNFSYAPTAVTHNWQYKLNDIWEVITSDQIFNNGPRSPGEHNIIWDIPNNPQIYSTNALFKMNQKNGVNFLTYKRGTELRDDADFVGIMIEDDIIYTVDVEKSPTRLRKYDLANNFNYLGSYQLPNIPFDEKIELAKCYNRYYFHYEGGDKVWVYNQNLSYLFEKNTHDRLNTIFEMEGKLYGYNSSYDGFIEYDINFNETSNLISSPYTTGVDYSFYYKHNIYLGDGNTLIKISKDLQSYEEFGVSQSNPDFAFAYNDIYYSTSKHKMLHEHHFYNPYSIFSTSPIFQINNTYPPTVVNIPNVVVNKDSAIVGAIDLLDYVYDPDTPFGELTFLINNPDSINVDVKFNQSSQNLIDIIPNGVWSGYFEFKILVNDNFNEAEKIVGVIVLGSQQTQVNVTSLLQGPYLGTTQMSTNLTVLQDFPLSQPFNSNPWQYSGQETISSIPANVVDWILVELRDKNNPNSIIAARAALLLNDGRIVDLDGTSPVNFSASENSYYLSIKHRNHISVQSSVTIYLSETVSSYDFTLAQTQAYGPNSMIDLGDGRWGLFSGDTDASGVIDATDRSNAWNDRNVTGYQNSDVEMNGVVDAGDRSIIWNNRNISVVIDKKNYSKPIKKENRNEN